MCWSGAIGAHHEDFVPLESGFPLRFFITERDVTESDSHGRFVLPVEDALSNGVGTNGKGLDDGVGTNKADNVEHYLNRPRATGDLHGQAALLWFAAELADRAQR